MSEEGRVDEPEQGNRQVCDGGLLALVAGQAIDQILVSSDLGPAIFSGFPWQSAANDDGVAKRFEISRLNILTSRLGVSVPL